MDSWIQLSVRCFIAVEVNEIKVIKALRNAQHRLASTGGSLKLVEKENIHLTLKFLGDVDETQLEKVKAVVSSINLTPFNLSMKGIGVFPNLRRPRTIWAAVTGGVSEITEIYSRMEDVLEGLGFHRENRTFSPHVTIARVRDGRNRDQLAEGIHEIRDLTFGSFKVERIVLKKSVLTPRGPIYSTIASSKANF